MALRPYCRPGLVMAALPLVSIAAPSLVGEFHLDPVQLGLVFSAFSWTYTPFQLPGGWLVDRVRPRLLYPITILLWSLATLSLGLANGLIALIALRMAIVLGDGPALNKLYAAARWGLGGPQLDGRWLPHRRYRGIGPTPTGPTTWHRHHDTWDGDQRFSWIHLDDLVSAVTFLDDQSFKQKVGKDEDVLVAFTAPWCGRTSTLRL